MCPSWMKTLTVTILTVVITLHILGQSKHVNLNTSEPYTNSQYAFNALSKKEFTDVVNASRYFVHLTRADLVARSHKTTASYKNAYINAYTPFSPSDRAKLQRLVLTANAILDKAGYSSFRAMAWNFVKVKPHIENGFPHTLGNVIVISDALLHQQPDEQIIETLLHEKVHVFQRLNPLAISQLIRQLGMRHLTSEEMQGLVQVRALMRSNPDLNNYIYMHEPSSLVMAQVYNSSTPKSISDSRAIMFRVSAASKASNASNALIGLPNTISCQLEHPYEITACLIAAMLTKNKYIAHEKNNKYIAYTSVWMANNL